MDRGPIAGDGHGGGVVLSAASASGPWKLTPATPIIPARASLYAIDVFKADARMPVYIMLSGGMVQLFFKPPAAGKKYLIDCKVDKANKHGVTVWPGEATHTFENTDHLVVAYEAVSSDEATVRIINPEPTTWFFYSCEVTPLN